MTTETETVATTEAPATAAAAPVETLVVEAGAATEVADAPKDGEQAGEAAKVEPKDEKPTGVQRRIDELTRARRDAEREAAHWKGIATQTAQSGAAERPNRDKFDTDEAYDDATADWRAGKALADQSRQAAVTATAQARQASWAANEAGFIADRPDYATIVGSSDIPIAPHVAEALMDSDAGPALAYHLAQNADVAARLNTLSPLRAAIELGRLETSLAAPPAKPSTNAPSPVTPIAGSRGTTVSLESADMDSYIATRRKQGASY